MRLVEFLRTNSQSILGEWDKFAMHLDTPKNLSVSGVLDHAAGMLDVIATDLSSLQSELQQREKSLGMGRHTIGRTEAELHGSSRFAEDFDVNQMMSEFRALRACVLRLWGERVRVSPDQIEEVTRFNEAIDQAMAESLACFTELKNRQTLLLEALLSTSPDLNYIIAPNGKLLYANNSFAKFFGRSTSELIGVDFLSLCTPFIDDIGARIRDVVISHKILRSELCTAHGSGDSLTFEYLLVPLLNEAGDCEAIAGSARDVTARKTSEECARRNANHDSLTDLPNRSLFHERLMYEIKRAGRTVLPLGLLFLDLDGFKNVNDSLGHAAGDQLLQQVAVRINSCVRETDTVARLGGDEFTVILPDITDPKRIDSIAAEIVSELKRPFMLTAGLATISASMGVALYPVDCDTPEKLVCKADEAMYESNSAGGNQFQWAKTYGQHDAASSS